ncbi:MAG: hypothetical protein IBX48_07000 [Thiomicrospira sp.]|uniref:outer membrane beta-barrel protein n=1 Tax=Thiomicrospira sp. TaxID=935 RepID=UPI0019E0C200|nr:outer membrane beta-barrel protein [Thiomicrospira sp.]MBE0494075.1 hypothetical protein [Thiomicrospira sp.]
MKNLFLKWCLVFSALLIAPSVMATNFSYSNLVLTGERMMFKEPTSLTAADRTINGVSLKVGYQWAPNLFTRFELAQYAYDRKKLNVESKVTAAGLGVGVAKAVTDRVDVYALVSAKQTFLEVKSTTNSSDEAVYLVGELGFRNWLTPSVEFNSAIVYSKQPNEKDKLDSSMHVPIGIGFWLEPNAAIHLKYLISEDFYGASLGYEVHF